MDFAHLKRPIQIGPCSLPNRMIMPAMELNYSMDGTVNDRHVAFYTARARGGVGLIVVGGCTIDRWAGPSHMISLKEDADLEGLRRLTGAVHEVGGLIGAQLYAAGAYSHRMLMGGEQAISASAHTSGFTREPCREMTLDEILEVQNNFVAAALRASEVGFDLVEICGSAGYLICQFLSPKTNRRQDRYGGSAENRMRFGVEVCQAVRAAVPAGTAVSIRIAGNDFVPESNGNAEACTFAAEVAPHVDLINVTGGWHETRVPQLPAEVPRGGFAYLARSVRRAVDRPVAASNRLGDPREAEGVLARGEADVICLGRPLIADPELPRKVSDGRVDEIVPCTACNQACFDAILRLQPVRCMVNPRAGLEGELVEEPVSTPRKIMVVGGGVAGLTTAITARRRGHTVTLYERGPELGGQVVWAAGPTHKPEFPRWIHHLVRTVERVGVEVRCNTEVDLEKVSASDPDAVVVAAGAAPVTLELPGLELDHVHHAWDVLKGAVEVGERVVVVGGGSVGCETAVWLARDGCLTPEQLAFLLYYDAEEAEELRRLQRQGWRQVHLLETRRRLAEDLGSRRWIVMDALRKHDVTVHKRSEVIAIEPGRVRWRDSEGSEQLIACDTVVLATGACSANRLAEQLQGRSRADVLVVGDAHKVGRIPDAVAAAYRLALEL